MGGASAIMSSTAGLPDNVAGIIADSAYTSAKDTGEQTISNLHLDPKFFYSQVRIDYKIRLKMADNAYTTIDALQENEKYPILFISGTKDKIATEKMQRELFAICKTKKKQLIVEGAGHMKSYYVDPEAYEKIFREFIIFSLPIPSGELPTRMESQDHPETVLEGLRHEFLQNRKNS